jgi:hypothetical protein
VRELIDRKDLERRVLGRDGADPVVAELSAAEPLGALAHSQFTSAGGPQVAHRLGFAAGRDEINGGPRG